MYRGITPATEAAIEVARRELQEEMGERLDDNQLLALLAARFRGGTAASKKAPAQVAVTVCPTCEVGRQIVGNRQVALRTEELARVFCDAQWIDVNGKARSVQDVTPALRAKVMLRDHGKCRVPGCRSAANIEVHHIVPWAIGGAHTMANLIALCDGHHTAHHRGDVRIEGPADRAVISNVAAMRADAAVAAADSGSIVHVDNRSDQSALGDRPTSEQVAQSPRADALLALTTMGFTKPEARRAVEAALDEDPCSLEELVRAALRRCAPR